MSGSGCLPGPVLNLLDKVIVNVTGVASVNTTVNADGTWSVPVVVPAVGPTGLKVSAVCLADGLLGSVLNYTTGLLNVVTNAVGDTSVTVGATLPTGGEVEVGITVPTTWDMHDDMVETTPKVEADGDTDTPTNGTSKVGAAGAAGATGAAGAAGAGGAGGAGATGAAGAPGAAGASDTGGTAVATSDAAAAPDASDQTVPTELASVECPGDSCATATDDGTSWWTWAIGGIAAACVATAGVAAVRRRRTGVATGTSLPRHEHSRSRS